jgi:hypothetical protein
MAVSALPAAAAPVHECVSAKPTAASYTWDFKSEANTIFKDVQSDAQQAMDHADNLQSFAGDNGLSWEAHAYQLEYLKNDINDIGAKLCRLETIRRVVAPWQQHEIDRIGVAVHLMADNAQDAIVFGKANPTELWIPSYRNYLTNLYNNATTLTRSVGNAVEFASASKEYRDLASKLGVRASS